MDVTDFNYESDEEDSFEDFPQQAHNIPFKQSDELEQGFTRDDLQSLKPGDNPAFVFDWLLYNCTGFLEAALRGDRFEHLISEMERVDKVTQESVPEWDEPIADHQLWGVMLDAFLKQLLLLLPRQLHGDLESFGLPRKAEIVQLFTDLFTYESQAVRQRAYNALDRVLLPSLTKARQKANQDWINKTLRWQLLFLGIALSCNAPILAAITYTYSNNNESIASIEN
jgi:hypothetical protein